MAPVIGGLALPVEHCLVLLVPVVYREPNGPLLAQFSNDMVCVKVAGLFDAHIYSSVGYISSLLGYKFLIKVNRIESIQ